MKFVTALLGTALTTSLATFSIFATDGAIRGFSTEGAKAQHALEDKMDAAIKPGNLDSWMKRMTAKPHHLGSAYDKENAEFIEAQFKSWGYQTEIAEYHVLMPTPKVRELTLISPHQYSAILKEDAVAGDPTSDQDNRLPPYVAYSPDGDVTAEVVFVNQGLKADYEDLARRGIDVKGKIVIAKFGGSWRGIKPKLAEEMGAIGCIMYTDPGDDGYAKGDVYPKGTAKHPTGVQRGSIMDLPKRPGDPLTPYIGATKSAKRLDHDKTDVMVNIPVLPISASDAAPILAALDGPDVPARWRGALPLTYQMGPGPAKVHLKVAFNWNIVPLYNVIATMEGSTYPDEWVMRGNHHDAWVHGAQDPVSGMVSTMEEARVIGELAKTGWRPKRTIKYAAWGGEEQGLIGSVEWVEDNREELAEKLVAYINTDGSSRGFLFAGGSHTLEVMFNEIVRDVDDPVKGVSLAKRHKAFSKLKADPSDASKIPDVYQLSALGSGSDYSGFFQHLGIASFNIGFGGEADHGSYHTNYDSHHLFSTFLDPGNLYGATLPKVTGRVTLRLAGADILPFQIGHFSATVAGYMDDLKSATNKMRDTTKAQNKLISEGLYDLADNPREIWVTPAPNEAVPYLNFAPLENALQQLSDAAKAFDAAYVNAKNIDKKTIQKINDLLSKLEATLTRSEGLPRRPWFRHHIYAPGYYTGYGVKTLPGVREAIEERKWEEADTFIGHTAGVITAFTKQVEKMTILLDV